MICCRYLFALGLIFALANFGGILQISIAQQSDGFAKIPVPSLSVPSADGEVRQAVARTPLPKPTSIGQQRTTMPQRSTSSSMLNTVFALGIVLSLFFGATVLIKRTWPQPVTGRIPSEVLEVLAIAELQPKQQWMLMRFGGKLLLVCQQAHETRVIAEVTDQQEIDRMVDLCKKPHSNGAAFASFSLRSQSRNSRSITG